MWFGHMNDWQQIRTQVIRKTIAAGIVISTTIDAIDRQRMLDILKTVMYEDELRRIRFLLSSAQRYRDQDKDHRGKNIK